MGHLNTHNRLHERRGVHELQQDAASTIVSVVYVTMSATFTGATAGYTTLTEGTATSTPAAASSSDSKTTTKKKATSTSASDSSSATSDATTSSAAAHTTGSSTTAATVTSTSAAAGSTSTLAADSSSSSSSSGLSGGAKAGIAIVVILLIAALLAAALFFVRRKKQQQKLQENRDNEKSTSGFTQLRDNDAQAPRLSLRPVTQFLPMLAAVKTAEPTEMHNEKEQRPGSNSSTNSANPFGHSAEQIDRAANAPIPVSSAPIPPAKPAPSAGLGVATGLAAGAAAGVAARSPPQARAPPPGNVHRVQLDFLPSMEDELELRAGQLIRVLHEYDDGWALCVYMDRSKQGVAPRTCLSQNPLKPRPNEPPPGMAPMRPQSPHMRPQSPGMRPQSPGMRNFSGPPPSASRDPLYPAPLSPSLPIMRTGSPGPHSPQAAAGRQRSYSQSQSPAPAFNPGQYTGSPVRDHRRSVSMNQLGNTSPGRGVPSRKPLPGM